MGQLRWLDGQAAQAHAPVAIVTGAARRIGRAIALELARAGLQVVGTCLTSVEQIEPTLREALKAGAPAAGWIRLDLNSPAEAAALLQQAVGPLPRLDALVHNAAVYEPSPLGAIDEELALRALRVNAVAPLLLTQALAPLLAQSPLGGGGAVVNLTDIHALGPSRRRYSPYLMSKAALEAMTRALALELAPGVRVNAVAPGVAAFPERGEEADPALQRRLLARVPLLRAGEPEDVARAVRFLVLEAPYVTGQTLRVDGGWSIAT